MKKTVAVCDIEACRRLADGECPLCEQDACSTHMCDRLLARFAVERMMEQPQGAVPSRKLEARVHSETTIAVCVTCALNLDAANHQLKGIFGSVAVGISKAMIDACRAKLVEYKLRQQK